MWGAVVNSQLETGVDDLVVVHAHPDDEILFFFGFLKFLAPVRLRLVCVTTEIGRRGEMRTRESDQAAAALGGERIHIGLRDCPGSRLNRSEINRGLARLRISDDTYVLTHGPLGEYGHPHHFDVFRATAAMLFRSRVWVLSGPLDSTHRLRLSADAFAAKKAFLKRFYSSQKTPARWAAPIERLTLLTEANCSIAMGSVVDPPNLMRQIEERCFGDQQRIPEEVRPIAANWGVGRLRARWLCRVHELLPNEPIPFSFSG